MNAKQAKKALREMINNGEITSLRDKYFEVGRCPSRHNGLRCGLPAVHGDDHTALIESDAPWLRASNTEGTER